MINQRNQKIVNTENRIKDKENKLDQRLGEVNKKEKQIEDLKNNISRQKEAIKRKEEEVEKHHRKQVEALETISGLSAEEAKKRISRNFER